MVEKQKVARRDKRTEKNVSSEKAEGRIANKKMLHGQQAHQPLQRGQQPEWASGLRRLYNSVVEEPLPDSFADLIAKLDAGDK